VPPCTEPLEVSELVALADRGWPAPETVSVAGWSARFAAGVTKRANSVWPREAVGDAVTAIEQVEPLYRARGIRPAFQLTDSDRALERTLRARGYDAVDETLIMVRTGCHELQHTHAETTGSVRFADEPAEEWLEVWWDVDGRGGAAEREVARRIMTGVPALYATLSDGGDGSVACVGRLALVGGRGGLYAVATRADARRRGHARTLLMALIAAAADRGMSDLWLQVLADNTAAVALYRSLGFSPAGGYRYLVAPLPG